MLREAHILVNKSFMIKARWMRETRRSSFRVPSWLRREMSGRVSGRLVIGWIALCLASLAAADGAPMRFLDLPIGVYLAIQGAFVGLVLIGISLLRPH
jgi:uncharacterized membrane protein